MSNPLQVPDRDNELLRDADDYLRKHKILELFEVRTSLSMTNDCRTWQPSFVISSQRTLSSSSSTSWSSARNKEVAPLFTMRPSSRTSLLSMTSRVLATSPRNSARRVSYNHCLLCLIWLTCLLFEFSIEDVGELRVSLHKGAGGSHPREGRPVHIHESVRRGARNQASLTSYPSPLLTYISANKNNKHTFWMTNYSKRLMTVINS